MRPTVLIVDDDAKFLTFMSRTLKRAGFRILAASDGCEASDVLAAHAVDVLIVDLHMPGMNGWELIRALRGGGAVRLQRRATPPRVIVVSGRDEDDTVAFVQRLGADAYLTKPIHGGELLNAVQRVSRSLAVE